MQQRNARMGVCADWAGRLCTSTLSSLPFLLARKHHQRQSKSSKPPPVQGGRRLHRGSQQMSLCSWCIDLQ